jgi:3-hydroxyacyl-CoA dehydrogenase
MFYADSLGLYTVRRRIQEFGRNPHGDPAFWTPAPLIERLVESGGTFEGAEGGAS